MAISYTEKTTNDKPKGTIEIDNGHLEALKKITNDYKIADIEKALGFILAVISKGNGTPIKIREDNFLPGQGILKTETTSKDESTK